MSALRPLFRIAVPALALMFSLAACGGEDDSASGAGDRPISATTEGPADDTTEHDDTSDEVDAAPTGAACLTGTWEADNEYFLAAIREFGDEIKDVSGKVTVTFSPGGQTRTVYEGWRIEASVEGSSSVIERNGLDVGDFSATDSIVSITETTMGSQLVVTAAGQKMHVPAAPVDYTDAQYTCSADEASITTPDGSLRLTR